MHVQINTHEIKKAISIMKPNGQLFEIRYISNSGKLNFSGYFTDVEILIDKLQHLAPTEEGNVYITLNAVNPACYSRQQRDKFIRNCKNTTSDNDIDGYDWLLVDLDPKRPSGTSSSDKELEEAHTKAKRIYEYLKVKGWNEPVIAMSGNGYHLLYKIYLDNGREKTEIVKSALLSLNMLFGDENTVDVDVTVFNPSRICKLYGTKAVKGSDTQERPHRLSKIIYVPDEIKINDIELVKDLANEIPEQDNAPQKYNNYNPKKFDLENWLSEHNVEITQVSNYQGGKRFILKECPFDSNHTGKDACIIQRENGAIGFKCFHQSCSRYGWKDFRQHYEPDAYLSKKHQPHREIKSDKKVQILANSKNNQSGIDEENYIREFVSRYDVRCINDRLYSADGVIPDGKAKQIIIKEILPFVKSNHGDKAEKLLKGVKQFCFAEAPEPDLDKIHFKNGTLSKDENGLFTVFSGKKEFCINRIAADYNPNAAPPKKFNEYLQEVYHSDDQITLQQFCGYCLLPTTVLQKALIVIGDGGEGKSTIGNILNGVIGSDNCFNESVNVLQNNFGVANVENKLLFIDDDLSEKALENARNFKNLVTNNNIISANKKHVQRNEFKSYIRFLCFGNFTLQALYDTSEGFTRRQLVLQAKPKRADRIDNLFLDKEIINTEAEGVVKWLVDGLNTLIKNNFKIYISARTEEVSERIKREGDTVTLFLDEGADYVTIKKGLSIHSAALYNLYLEFCEDNAINSLKRYSFIASLKSKGKSRGIRYDNNVSFRGRRARGFVGIGVDVQITH